MAAESTAHAVWTGRFQPPHVGHFAILRRSIETLLMPHVVVLSYHFGWRSDGRYGRLARAAYSDARNPLSVWERYRLMTLGLAGHALEDRVLVVTAPRHDYDWRQVSAFYPPRRLICLTAKDEFESAKEELWRARGEKVYVFRELNAEHTMTTTRIRDLIRRGHEWRRYIPEACHSYFEEIDGPRRVFHVERA